VPLLLLCPSDFWSSSTDSKKEEHSDFSILALAIVDALVHHRTFRGALALERAFDM
jgi:hypothetical protein